MSIITGSVSSDQNFFQGQNKVLGLVNLRTLCLLRGWGQARWDNGHPWYVLVAGNLVTSS